MTSSRSTQYVHGHAPSVLRTYDVRTAKSSAAYVLEHLEPGTTVLDVGCGAGSITADLAEIVAPAVVVGVDTSAEALAKARDLAAARNLVNVRFVEGDALSLDLPDGSVDVVHAHQVLQHLADPVAALREMRRVCRPGGLVAARDADYAAMTWWPEEPALTSWLALYRAVSLRQGAQPDAGRRLLSWALAAGFDDVTPSASTWCYATPEARELWGGSWAQRVIESGTATAALAAGLATDADLADLSAGWRRWVAAPDGWFTILHGEVLCRA